ncbi:MAG: helix-turn-helix transcriptional regulator [Clostridia bacterium]|nr:helix-turn-helix transcriptional regulator [Clostridia bacterium]
MKNYGIVLKEFREEKGISQSELAKLTGIKQQNISRWESGTTLPNIDFCVQLADFYGISLDELVGRDLETVYKK